MVTPRQHLTVGPGPKKESAGEHFIPGAEIRALMRKHRWTIQGLAGHMNITQKRVREARKEGVVGTCICRDWMEGITGVDAGAN